MTNENSKHKSLYFLQITRYLRSTTQGSPTNRGLESFLSTMPLASLRQRGTIEVKAPKIRPSRLGEVQPFGQQVAANPEVPPNHEPAERFHVTNNRFNSDLAGLDLILFFNMALWRAFDPVNISAHPHSLSHPKYSWSCTRSCQSRNTHTVRRQSVYVRVRGH